MWTPKRIVILSVCFAAFFMVYLGYAYTYVGRIDGLPPLPEIYCPCRGYDQPLDLHVPERSNLQKKLRQAFGNDAKELKWPIRLDIHPKNMVLAAAHFELREGRVCLTPLSIAIIGKDKGDGLPPEIHTIRGEVAYLKFDRPVTNFSEIPSRKITEAELTGRISLVSNRRRKERDEDLRVEIPSGTLYYKEATHRLWTEAFVKLEDYKSKPEPHKITGKGMEIELATEMPAPKAGGVRKQQREAITGVKWLSLQANVTMDLYFEGQSGLVVSNPRPQAPTTNEPARSSQRAHLRITTPGQFRYDMLKDHDLARFVIAPAGAPRPIAPPQTPQHVVVTRTNLATRLTDQLVCEHLTLRLKRKENTKGPRQPAGSAKGAGRPVESSAQMEAVEIETVHATAPEGKRVVLVSNSEHLTAEGRDFFHDAARELSILKGTPVDINKDDSIIHARELRIQNVRPLQNTKPGQVAPKPYQHIIALGPGEFLLEDRKQKRTIRASWRNLLTSTKDGNQDLLTLTGDAHFIDVQAEQNLKADTLKLWLEEVEKPKAQPRNEASADSRRPRHLEALGNVVARSRDLNVHDTSKLVVWFKDVPGVARLPGTGREPARPVPSATTTPGSAPPWEQREILPRPLPTGPAQPGRLTSNPGPSTGPVLNEPENRPAARPFDLSGRAVEAWVHRAPDRSTLDQLWCEGSVHVRQDPARAEEKGTEIKGDTLRMTAKGEGLYDLIVTGDLAELQTDKIYIIGPEVNIDQSMNKAWVNGDGAMKMDSRTNFQGDPLEKPVPLTVHWSKNMLFSGDRAEFEGNIQAVQEKARLASQKLQVFFDRTISLKQGNKNDKPASVKTLVCSQDVRVEDSAFESERLAKYQRLEARWVQMHALEPDEENARPTPATTPRKTTNGNEVRASGPGNIRIWEPNSGESPLGPGSDPRPPAGRSTSAKPAPPEMKMTFVSFQGSMSANSKTNSARFYDGVQVLHIPCPRHDQVINLDVILSDDLPEKSLYIRCDKLQVLDMPEKGKPNKQMEANGRVLVQGREFHARSDHLAYNQQKQQVILTGKDGNNATLWKQTRRGEKPQEVVGRQIIYNRSTGEISVNAASSISGESAVPRK